MNRRDADSSINQHSAAPTRVTGWYYTFPDGKARGPFKRREIATRWRRYRIIRSTPPDGKYVPHRLAWQHAGIDPFVGERHVSV